MVGFSMMHVCSRGWVAYLYLDEIPFFQAEEFQPDVLVSCWYLLRRQSLHAIAVCNVIVRVCLQARNEFNAALLMLSGFHSMADHVRAWGEGRLLPEDSMEGSAEQSVAESAATLLSLAVQPKVRVNILDKRCTSVPRVCGMKEVERLKMCAVG